MEGLKLNLKHAASNLAKLGDIYSQLSSCYSEIEKWSRPELDHITPKLGDLYNTLKNSVFQLSNTYEQHSNIFSKYFERTLQDVFEQSSSVVEVGSLHPANKLPVGSDQAADLLGSESENGQARTNRTGGPQRHQAQTDECGTVRVDRAGLQLGEGIGHGHHHQFVSSPF